MIQNNISERKMACRLLTAEIEPLMSSLSCAHGGGIEKLLLEMFLCGGLKNSDNIKDFLECTLLAIQNDLDTVYTAAQEAFHFLQIHQFVNVINNKTVMITPLGRASCLSGISPKDSLVC